MTGTCRVLLNDKEHVSGITLEAAKVEVVGLEIALVRGDPAHYIRVENRPTRTVFFVYHHDGIDTIELEG